MKNCLLETCQKELTHIPGRKEKSFCNVNCRNKYFYAERKRRWNECLNAVRNMPTGNLDVLKAKIGFIDKDGNIKPPKTPPVQVKDLTQPTNQIKPQEQPKTNYSINALPKETEAGKPPKTLDELKAMCPADLTGFDKSQWISTERQKYGI